MSELMLTRRSLIQKSAAVGTGLVIGIHLTRSPKALAEVGTPSSAPIVTDPNAFLRIAPDNTVTVLVKHIEFGQGVFTGFATLVAEELDADWSQMRAESAPSNPKLYQNYAFGAQGTGGSTAIPDGYRQMRLVGATARAMLVNAAAKKWRVSRRRISVEKGVVKAGSKSATFGELAEAAMALPAPKRVRLKKPKDFKLIGTERPKLDTGSKSNGQAQYTIDVDRPNLLTVLVAHPPRFGATVKSFDASAAASVPGFVAAKQLSSGVAVYADGYWPALKARKMLKVEWDDANAETRSTSAIRADYEKQLSNAGMRAVGKGSLPTEAAGTEVISADYTFPYLAHAPMEPLDIVIEKTKDGAEAWFGSQLPTMDHFTIAKILGLTPDKVKINVMFGGGSFGRRAQPDAHLAREGAEALKASPDGRPVKLVFTREDDITGGYYRPMYAHRLRATVKNKAITGWAHHIVGQSIVKNSPFEMLIKDGIDHTSVEGAVQLPYTFPGFSVDLTTTDAKVPVLWWRSVGSTHTGFSVETFVDEVLLAIGETDQVAGRLKYIKEDPRHAGVLKAAAKLAGWPRPKVEGREYGVAVHKSFGTYVAQIAEVGLRDDGMPMVSKVWCAVDCGVAVNPNVIAAQMEGGIGFGLGAALFNEVTLEDGVPQQKNFDGYRPLRIHEMPDVEVAVVDSDASPTGVGEPGVPVIAPAIANAYFRLTGKRVRNLPFINNVEPMKPRGNA